MRRGTDGLLLDTCAWLWLTHGDPMSGESLNAISNAQAQLSGLYVAAMTAWEIATLVSKGRYQLFVTPTVWFERLLALDGARLAQATPDIMIESAFLPGRPPTDPVDRILAATARRLGLTLITRDRRLLDYGTAGHLRALAC